MKIVLMILITICMGISLAFASETLSLDPHAKPFYPKGWETSYGIENHPDYGLALQEFLEIHARKESLINIRKNDQTSEKNEFIIP